MELGGGVKVVLMLRYRKLSLDRFERNFSSLTNSDDVEEMHENLHKDDFSHKVHNPRTVAGTTFFLPEC